MANAYVDGLIDIHDLPPDDVIFGYSARMAVARSKLQLATATGAPVLLQGESGTGKEIFAKMLHIRSLRSRFAWVKVICPAVPASLIESEFFGYEKSAFSGAYTSKRGWVEVADRGTLFLDEIGSLDLPAQAKLLELLQDARLMRVGDREACRIDARLVSSANVDLKPRTEDGSFLVDLFYRLNAITIDLPPLRQRIEDLPVLIDHFFEAYSRSFHRNPRPLSSEIVRSMRQFAWPGNIRQLENMVRSYILIGDEDVLADEFIPEVLEVLTPDVDLAHPVSLKEITKAATEKLERDIILKALEANGGNRRKTARWLNISYRSLLYKLGEANLAGCPVRARRSRLDQHIPLA